MTSKPALREHELDITRSCFGIKFVSGGSPEGCFELYLENDELWHYQLTANNFWLPDLIATARAAQDKLRK